MNFPWTTNLPWKSSEFKNITWPDNARMAVLLNSEYEAVRGIPRLAQEVRDLREISSREFEARCGLSRILDLLEGFGVRGTIYVNGATAETFPESVQEIKRRGHEIAAHGYQAENLWELKAEDETRLIEKIVSSIDNVIHERPVGWLSPRAQPSETTMEILMEMGFIWNSDLFDAELPYLIEVGGKRIVEIPRSFSTDDISLPYTNPTALFDAWRDEFDYLYKESAKSPKMFMITWHYHITGRPSRAKALEDILTHITGHSGIWFARNIDIAKLCLENG